MSWGSIIAIGLVVWTVASIWFFLATLGEKYRKTKWYDYLLAPPGLALAWIIKTIYRILKR